MKCTLLIHIAGTLAASIPYVLGSVALAEQPYPVEWIEQLGSSGTSEGVKSMAADDMGNIYVTGFSDSSLIGPSLGNYDAFLIKYDSSGTELWSKQLGSSHIDISHGVTLDGSGNPYITGYTFGDLGGANAGSYDPFLMKFDTLGNELWSRQPGTALSERSYSIAADAVGNTYITGKITVETSTPGIYTTDVFLKKFDPSGTEAWSREVSTPGLETGYEVAVDAAGDVYLTGDTEGELGGPNAGDKDVFLIKYDTTGSEVWSRQFGTSGYDSGKSVAIDGSGNIYISGQTSRGLSGPYLGGVADGFLMKLDPTGSELWSRQIGTSDMDWSNSVFVDDLGNAHITGRTGGDLGGTQMGEGDPFIIKFDPSGNELWSQQIGTSVYDYSETITVDHRGNVYIGGGTQGSLGGPHAGGRYDAYFAKFAAPIPGDPNGDGFVGIEDLSIVLGNWNSNVTPGDVLSGDLTGDGFVGIEDLNTVLSSWNLGTPPGAGAIPEPGTLCVLGVGAVLVGSRRGRNRI